MKKAFGSLVAGSLLVIGMRAHAEPSGKLTQRAPRSSVHAKHVRGSKEPGNVMDLEPVAPSSAAQILFSSADRDGNAIVSYAEFASTVRESVARRARIRLRQLDRNHDGVCTPSEVNKMSRARFARFDLDHDSAFSEQELATVMLRELTARLDQLYATLDRDHDGQFSVAELTPRAKPAAVKLAKQESPRKSAGPKALGLASRRAANVY